MQNMHKIEVCRTCLGTENLSSIFDGDTDYTIMTIAAIKIEPNDMLPESICAACFERVKDFCAFRQMCESNDRELRSRLACQTESQAALTSGTEEDLTHHQSLPSTDPLLGNDHTNTRLEVSETTVPPAEVSAKSKKLTQCNVCGKVVSSEFRLACHMRIHTGEKPFKCEYCGKAFALAYNLKVHERIHTGYKPLHCTICDKQFAQSAGLISHMRMHTGEKPYKCMMCPMSFKTCSHLQYHIRLHTGEKKFVCEICDRRFITKGDLTQHKRTHTGERTYVCTICGQTLTRNYHLTRHMLTHSGIKNFKCTVCEFSYSQKSDLKRHILKHSASNVRQLVNKQTIKAAVVLNECQEEIC